jgi:hypothetical protein
MPVPRRRSIFGQVIRGIGWLASSPVHWLGVATIRRGGTFIGDLAERLRPRPRRDPRFRTTERGVFDLGATAWSLGVSVVELRHRLDARRRQTAVAAYLLAGLGVAFFLGWLLQVLHTPMTHGRMLLAFDFLPLCLLFVLLAFHQALVNFQIRVGRTAGWREYLTADDGFWPRM